MPTALALSAGGMYAAWEVGVWKSLRKYFAPDLIVGASAGAWNGWAIAGGCPVEELIDMWLDPETGAILRPELHFGSIVKPEMLYAKARELFSRFHPRIPYGLTVVEAPFLRPRLVRDGAITWRHLAATCSIPVVFPPVRIGSGRYLDGGVAGALPLWAAAEMGATRAVALNVLTGFPFRTIRRILRPPRPKSDIDVTLLEPSARLGPLSTAVKWSRANIERWIELGERDANRLVTSITM